MVVLVPVERDSGERECRRAHRGVGSEVVDGAKRPAEGPALRLHEAEAEAAVEDGVEEIGQAQLQDTIRQETMKSIMVGKLVLMALTLTMNEFVAFHMRRWAVARQGDSVRKDT